MNIVYEQVELSWKITDALAPGQFNILLPLLKHASPAAKFQNCWHTIYEKKAKVLKALTESPSGELKLTIYEKKNTIYEKKQKCLNLTAARHCLPESSRIVHGLVSYKPNR